MLECMYDWSRALELGHFCDIIYIDFAKAFDTVCHKKLLIKLEAMGIKGYLLNWIKSYLNDRSQQVIVDNTFSDSIPVISGVPQGSVLGPLLFLVYINDIVSALPDGVKIKLFADDCKIYIIFSYNSNLPSTLSLALDNIFNWIETWQLKLSLEKCAVLHLGHNNPRNKYYIGNHLLSVCSNYKDLGFIIDDKLNFKNHYDTIITKGYRMSNLILRALHGQNPRTIIWAYCTYVRPILEYGSSIWCPYKKCDIQLIEDVQACVTRRALGYHVADLNRPSYADRLKYFNLQTLEHRRLINDLCLVYKIVNNAVDTSLIYLIEPISNSTRGHEYRFRVKNRDGSRKNPKKCMYRNFFLNRIVGVWNFLPIAVFDVAKNGNLPFLSRYKLFKKSVVKLNLDKFLKLK
jgi:ribonucleases P/MRP protein subunit RPP40